MTIFYSPSAHENTESRSSGFYFSNDPNAPSDAFLVSSEDHRTAINLPQGAMYSFTAPISPEINGILNATEPTNEFLLAQAKVIQLAAIDAAYIAENTLPIEYMGTSFQADQASQDLITGVMIASGELLPRGFMWYDVHNIGVDMAYSDLQGLAGEILSRGQPLFNHKQMQKAAIRAATTIEDVESIVW